MNMSKEFNYGIIVAKFVIGLIFLLLISDLNFDAMKNWADNKIVEAEQVPGLAAGFGLFFMYVLIQAVPPVKKLVLTPIEQIQKGTETMLKNLFN